MSTLDTPQEPHPVPTIETSVWLTLAVAAVSAVVAIAVGELAALAVRRLGRRREILCRLGQRGRRPLAALLGLLAARTALQVYTRPADWRDPTLQVIGLLVVAMVAWLLVVAVNTVQDVLLRRYDVGVADNRRARQRRTQVTLLKRIVVVAIVVVAVASMMLTIPGARGLGASVLASAGLLSVVAGLAAQTSLANVFAGLQIAFTDGLRVDDVVVVEGEWGNIEDITLTYVVVRVWDQRRLILPSTYFTTTPFQNWTRSSAEVVGAVEADVDWDVPVDRVRGHLEAFVAAHPNWDGRTYALQVTDAVGSFVRLRVLVSAGDAGRLFDLRCAVREELVALLRDRHPQALPRVRVGGTRTDTDTSGVDGVDGVDGARGVVLPRQDHHGRRGAGVRGGRAALDGVDGARRP
ncbi:mechanosensitive ion channel family protein [Kineococcus sp. SYSU DK004]|uniref:mechanosensitive ion channel family protein n=1 Tax=Kineococcus sp. SYSU DK004 TaxID=3383125 RepID=UPI003D7EA1A5